MFKGVLGLLKGSANKPKTNQMILSPAIKDNILSIVGARSISAMPGAAQKAFALAANPKAESRDFVEVIEADEALAARVIKIANSVFFDRGKKSSTIEEAVVIIGLNELRNLLNANALADIFKTSNPSRTHLWAHDIAVAIIARQLAQKLLPSSVDIAFLSGLMHDVGKLLLIQRCPEEYAKILSIVEQKGISFCQAEAEVFPFDHCEVGQLIAEKWSFAPELTKVIRLHHKVDFNTVNKSPDVIQIVAAANIIAHSLGLGFNHKFSRLRLNNQELLPQVWQSLQINKSDADSLQEQAKRTFDSEYELYAGKF